MLLFNEGVPRSGKSFDGVSEHILPALRAGRKVYARLNGLDHVAIAAYLQMPVEDIEALLIQVPTADVRSVFVAVRDGAGQWVIPDALKDALFVIDEAHEFYVSSRLPIDPAVEQFFALCGQNGMDGVLMSQWFKRLHSAIRARVERKNVFQKLTAVGMEGKYLLKRYQTLEPDRFELVDSVVRTYNPKIFPLYAGYAPGSANTVVYAAGGTTVWKRLRVYAVPLSVVLVIAVWFLWHFVSTGGRGLLRDGGRSSVVGAQSHSSPVASAVNTASEVVRKPKSVDLSGMPDEVRYVFDLCNQTRPRLAAVLTVAQALPYGVIEWPQAQSHSESLPIVLDRMTFAQLRDLGVDVQVHVYGVKLVWRDRAVIVTPWPMPERPRASKLDGGDKSDNALVVESSQAESGESWKASDMRADYVPPELEKRPLYQPHTLQ
jgi:zona occludens toxin